MTADRIQYGFVTLAVCWLAFSPIVALGAHYDTSAEAKAAADSSRQQMQRAESRAKEVRRRLDDMAQQLAAFRKRGPDVQEIDGQIAKVGHQIWILNQQRAMAILDLRNGKFCSDCKRSKTQIETEEAPKTFEQHIQEGAASGRHKVDATPEMFAQTEKHYNDLIDPLKNELLDLQRQRTERVSQFEAQAAQYGHQMDGVRLQLLSAGVDGDNARFQMNQALASAQTLEQAEWWKAELERRRAEEKARDEKIAAERARREAEWNAWQAKEEARKARQAAEREAAAGARKRAEEADVRAHEAEQARQRALEREQLAKEAEDRRQYAHYQFIQTPTPATAKQPTPTPTDWPVAAPGADEQLPSLPAPHEPTGSNAVPSYLPRAAQEIAKANETLDRLRDDMRNRVGGAFATAADPGNAPPRAIDSLASLGQAPDGQASDEESWFQRAEHYARDQAEALRQAPTEAARDTIRSAIEKAPNWLLEKQLDYGRKTLDQRVENTIHSSLEGLAQATPGGETGMVGLLKKEGVGALTAYASEEARKRFATRMNDLLLNRHPVAEADAAALANRDLEDAAGVGNLTYRTLLGSSGNLLHGVAQYGNDEVIAFGELMNLWTADSPDAP